MTDAGVSRLRWPWWWLAALPLLAGGCAGLPLRPPDPASAGKVIELARSLLGTPYRYGGKNPSGFDCSGLVQYVYQEAAGVRLPRTSRAQYRRAIPLSLGQEKPGDLVFFRTRGWGPSHVGIYLGRGKFIHAPNHGRSVAISDANEDYWRSRFIAVGRVL